MTANMGQTRAIARSLAALIVAAALPLVAQGQAGDSVRARKVDSALLTYRLPGIASGPGTPDAWVRRATPSATSYGWRRPADGARTIVVPAVPADRPELSLECPMPIANGRAGESSVVTTREVMDSVAANPPGAPVPMPTRRYPCVNPLR